MKQIRGKKRAGALAAYILLAVVIALSCSLSSCRDAQAFEHGTTDKKVTEDMVNNKPPADYQIDQSVRGDAKDGEYNKYFLKDGLQTVSIDIEENNLNYLLQNADKKPTVMTKSVTIGDKTLGYTGLKTKGSYTLEHAFKDNPGSDRFSFTVNFGKFIKKKNGYSNRQNFYGCNKISFNNLFFDKSMMKEYIAMELMSEMGVPTPQHGLARLYINGAYYGVYFMVEALDSSILEQYLGVKDKKISSYLTKPENTTLEYDDAMDRFQKEDGTYDLSSVLKKDAEGNYKALDELEDQAPLWEEDPDTLQDVAEMLPTVLAWQKKLTQLSKGKDFEGKDIDVNSEKYVDLLEQIMDVDEALRYFATHSWLVQIDDMFVEQHNLGVYVGEDGRSMMMPWDYDLSFGCYYPSAAETTANMHVDLMYKKNEVAFHVARKGEVTLDYRRFPFFQVIYQNKSLMERYHQYMKDCSKIAALGGTTSSGRTYTPGRFSACIEKMEGPLVKAASEILADNVYYLHGANQPGDMQYALPNLKKIIALRALGVLMQVDGMDVVVSGGGCNLESLGNAIYGMSSSMGRLGTIDEDTGLYPIAQYSGSQPPSLNIRELEEGESVYQKMAKALGGQGADRKMYAMSNSGTVKGNYTLYIPVEKEKAESMPSVYSYTDKGGLEKLDVVKEGESYKVTTGSLDYIAVIHGEAGNVPEKESLPVWILPAGGGVLLAAAVVVIVMVRRRNR